MSETPTVSYWMDRPLTELTREELIEAVEQLGRDVERTRQIPKDFRRMAADKAQKR